MQKTRCLSIGIFGGVGFVNAAFRRCLRTGSITRWPRLVKSRPSVGTHKNARHGGRATRTAARRQKAATARVACFFCCNTAVRTTNFDNYNYAENFCFGTSHHFKECLKMMTFYVLGKKISSHTHASFSATLCFFGDYISHKINDTRQK